MTENGVMEWNGIKSMKNFIISVIIEPTLLSQLKWFSSSKTFNPSNALTVRAKLFTEVPEYGSLNGHLGIHKEVAVQISFTHHRLLANIFL